MTAAAAAGLVPLLLLAGAQLSHLGHQPWLLQATACAVVAAAAQLSSVRTMSARAKPAEAPHPPPRRGGAPRAAVALLPHLLCSQGSQLAPLRLARLHRSADVACAADCALIPQYRHCGVGVHQLSLLVSPRVEAAVAGLLAAHQHLMHLQNTIGNGVELLEKYDIVTKILNKAFMVCSLHSRPWKWSL